MGLKKKIPFCKLWIYSWWNLRLKIFNFFSFRFFRDTHVEMFKFIFRSRQFLYVSMHLVRVSFIIPVRTPLERHLQQWVSCAFYRKYTRKTKLFGEKIITYEYCGFSVHEITDCSENSIESNKKELPENMILLNNSFIIKQIQRMVK